MKRRLLPLAALLCAAVLCMTMAFAAESYTISIDVPDGTLHTGDSFTADITLHGRAGESGECAQRHLRASVRAACPRVRKDAAHRADTLPGRLQTGRAQGTSVAIPWREYRLHRRNAKERL